VSTEEVSEGLANARAGLAQAEKYRQWSGNAHMVCVVVTAVWVGCAVLLSWTFIGAAMITGAFIWVTKEDVKRWTKAVAFWEHMIERWEKLG
jgi:hypothetical protein